MRLAQRLGGGPQQGVVVSIELAAALEPAPLLLHWDVRLTPEQFERMCQVNPEAVLELAAYGALIAITPTG